MKASLQFHAIFVFCTTKRVWAALQVFCDLVSTKDGRILGQKRSENDPQFVKLFLSNPDLLYKDKWPESRFGPRVINIMLQSVMMATYGYKMQIE